MTEIQELLNNYSIDVFQNRLNDLRISAKYPDKLETLIDGLNMSMYAYYATECSDRYYHEDYIEAKNTFAEDLNNFLESLSDMSEYVDLYTTFWKDHPNYPAYARDQFHYDDRIPTYPAYYENGTHNRRRGLRLLLRLFEQTYSQAESFMEAYTDALRYIDYYAETNESYSQLPVIADSVKKATDFRDKLTDRFGDPEVYDGTKKAVYILEPFIDAYSKLRDDFESYY